MKRIRISLICCIAFFLLCDLVIKFSDFPLFAYPIPEIAALVLCVVMIFTERS